MVYSTAKVTDMITKPCSMTLTTVLAIIIKFIVSQAIFSTQTMHAQLFKIYFALISDLCTISSCLFEGAASAFADAYKLVA